MEATMTENKTTLFDALFAVQQKAPSISKQSDNPFFKSKYASLPDIWDSIRDLMGENNLFVYHNMDVENGDDYIVTSIYHVPTNKAITSKSKIMLSKSNAQEYGSYITYMRRYALTALLGLVMDDDDDGNNAVKGQNKQVEPSWQPNEQFKTYMEMKNWALDFRKSIQEAKSIEELETLYKLDTNNVVKAGALDDTFKKMVKDAIGKQIKQLGEK